MPKPSSSRPTSRRQPGRAQALPQLAPLSLALGPSLTLDSTSVRRLLLPGSRVTLSAQARRALNDSRAAIDRALGSGRPHYGINTGFGSLANRRINPDDLRTLQRNLVRSHATGAGEPLRPELVRATMLLLAASLSRGLSGVRPQVVATLVDMFNAGVVPVVPSIGSVGASGDLAPLAHIALVLIGEGHAQLAPAGRPPGRVQPASGVLKAAGVAPLVLDAKEGLALINGTHLMAAEGALLCHDAAVLFDTALTALAMSIDACRATDAFLDDRLYAARNHPAARDVASRLRGLLRGSTIVTSHRENDPRVQDPYSLRAGPTVLAAALRTIQHAQDEINRELNAVTDNPLVFPAGGRGGRRDRGGSGTSSSRDAILSGANFHGMPVAIPLDTLAIAMAHIAAIAERRVYLITGAFEPESRLKPFLAPQPGLESGLMIAQYAAAACVNELVGLAAPASVVNIPTCAGMEDYNSFGPRAAAKARRGVELARSVLAIELLCAAQAMELHRPLRSGRGVEAAHATIRRVVAPLKGDRPLTADIAAIEHLIAAGQLRAP